MVKNIDFSKWNSKEENFSKYKNVKSILVYGKTSEIPKDISIIIPTFRRHKLLKYAIESAVSQVGYKDYEVIVIDNDDSIDLETDKLMHEYTSRYNNVVYYRNEKNLGLLGNWNRCIEICRSKYFCMLHDDDILMENYLSTVMPIVIKNNLDVLSVYRQLIDINNNNSSIKFSKRFNFIRKTKENEILELNISDCINSFMPYLAGAVLKKQACIDIGGFDDRFGVNDRFFVAKMINYKKYALLPCVLYKYRVAVNQGTNNFQIIKEIGTLSYYLVYEMCKELGYGTFKTKFCATCEIIMQGKGLVQLYPQINLKEFFGDIDIYKFLINFKKIIYFRHDVQRTMMFNRKRN